MQDFDFGKYYQKNGLDSAGATGGPTWIKKLSLLGSIVIVTFFMGMITGIIYQKDRFAPPVDGSQDSGVTQTSNINPDQAESTEEILNGITSNSSTQEQSSSSVQEKTAQNRGLPQALQSDQAEYIILAKIYSSYEEAHLNGLKLQKVGLPVFLTESGQKMKVYVGPITGKNRAYNMLAQIKKLREFNGAILYQK